MMKTLTTIAAIVVLSPLPLASYAADAPKVSFTGVGISAYGGSFGRGQEEGGAVRLYSDDGRDYVFETGHCYFDLKTPGINPDMHEMFDKADALIKMLSSGELPPGLTMPQGLYITHAGYLSARQKINIVDKNDDQLSCSDNDSVKILIVAGHPDLKAANKLMIFILDLRRYPDGKVAAKMWDAAMHDDTPLFSQGEVENALKMGGMFSDLLKAMN
jgi:hypothetical protein